MPTILEGGAGEAAQSVNDKASFALILSPTDISAFRMAELMSRKAYARYRGCDPAAVRYAIRRGWVIPDPATGMIDPA